MQNEYGLPPTDSRPRTISVTLVTSDGCHFCEMAKDIIETLALVYPLEVAEVDMAGPEGMAIMRTHQVPFPPALLVDGRFHAFGRISAKGFRKHLDEIMREP